MATIDDLKKSITELDELELRQLISERRLSRRIQKTKAKKGKTVKPKKIKTPEELATTMSAAQKLALLAKLEDV